MGQRQTGGQRAFGVCRTGQPQLIPVRQQLITKSGLVWTSSAVLAAEGRWPRGDSPWFGGSLNSRLVCVGGTFNLIPALRALSSPALWHPQSSSHTQLLLLEQDQLQTTMCCSSGSPPRVTLAPAPGELRALQSSGGAQSRLGRGAGSSSPCSCRAGSACTAQGHQSLMIWDLQDGSW